VTMWGLWVGSNNLLNLLTTLPIALTTKHNRHETSTIATEAAR
jgi:hypothetical protein